MRNLFRGAMNRKIRLYINGDISLIGYNRFGVVSSERVLIMNVISLLP